MSIEREDIEAIVSAVWESILERPLWSTEEAGEFRRAGNIDIMGLWSGSVMLEVDRPSLRRAAAAMFERPTDEVTEFQMNDALAELTNMIGGNVKCLIDQPTRLSLPSVQTVDLDDPDIGQIDQLVTLTDGEGTLRVKLIHVS
jgi:chemotaxis protein CheX